MGGEVDKVRAHPQARRKEVAEDADDAAVGWIVPSGRDEVQGLSRWEHRDADAKRATDVL